MIPPELRIIIDGYSTMSPSEAAGRSQALLEATIELSAEVSQAKGIAMDAKTIPHAKNRQLSMDNLAWT